MEERLMDEQDHKPYAPLEWHGRTFARPTPYDAKPPSIDATRISLLTEREMRYWTDELRVTIYEVRDAIKATDSRDPSVVRAWLQARSRGAIAA
jgi:hypothetical protein